jgi:hypothetical protein
MSRQSSISEGMNKQFELALNLLAVSAIPCTERPAIEIVRGG